MFINSGGLILPALVGSLVEPLTLGSPFASLPATVCTYSGLAGLRIVEIKRSAYVRTNSPAGGLLDCDDMVGAQRRES